MIRFKVLDLHTFISFVLGKSQDLGTLPVTSKCPNPDLWLGKTEGRTSPCVGCVCEE